MKIVNRIVTALLAAAAFPFLITQFLFEIILSVNEESIAYGLINLFAGTDNMLTGNRLGFQESILSLFKMMTQQEGTSDFNIVELWNSLPADLDTIKKLVVAAFVCVAVGAVVALVIVGCAIFTKAYKTIMGLGLGGAACFLAGIILFGKAGEPLKDGTIDVVKLIADFIMGEDGTTSAIAAIATSLLQGTVEVDVFALGGAVFGAMIMLIAVAVWEFAYYITLPEKERKVKKIKKA
ncbi:MAG: hypothetical protein IJZ88_05340 [Clostridia bacterium]|nr:hypothetical protein [Clostridia bacterium]